MSKESYELKRYIKVLRNAGRIAEEHAPLVKKHSIRLAALAAIEALEKQMPYKPQPFKHYYGKCKCGVVFLDNLTKYCGNCGQRLDWSETE